MEIVLIVVVIILALATMYAYLLIAKLKSQYADFLQGADGRKIEYLLKEYANNVKSVDHKLDQLASFTAKLHKTTSLALTRAGFVRFNPFDDTGGDQSFCLALIDSSDSGFVISSIHARTGTRMYAKQIIKGKSSHHLSDEETQALRKALEQSLPIKNL